MFTGIIESSGILKEILDQGTNKTFWIKSDLFAQLKIDQSLAHDGVCLTIEDLKEGLYKVSAVQETLKKSTLDSLKIDFQINLERCLLTGSRLDGHFVQGHVDTVGTCSKMKNLSGSWELTFEYPKRFSHLIIEKGSICVNGISLTAYEVKKSSFKVSIIPYTWKHTNCLFLKKGSLVNLEFDIIGKYVDRKLSLKD